MISSTRFTKTKFVKQATFSCISGSCYNLLSTVSGICFNGPSDFYKYKLETGALHPDENQAVVVEHMQALHDDLKPYQHKVPLAGFFTKFFGKFSDSTQSKELHNIGKYSDSPRGLYLHGGVGCGKTMLMDLFHESCAVEKKQRIHFHQFMLDVHNRIHDVKQAMGTKNFNLNRSQPYDPIAPVAKDISFETTLLCFDEFQVTDIADAMILKRLFYHLWQNGVVVFATSNRKPDDLYKNGLQRFHFLPFIPMLKANCLSVNINSLDYRRLALPAEGNTYFSATEFDIKYEMDRVYEELVSRSTGVEGVANIEVMGRTLRFERTCGRILDTTFYELCMKPLGAVDYLELSKNFDTILLRDIPCLSLEKRSEARRFITLIDMLYDKQVKVIFSAENTLDKLFQAGDLSEYDRHHAKVLIGDLNINRGDSNETASLFTGEEELFAFERTISRMTEMSTAAYWSDTEQSVLTSHDESTDKTRQVKAS